MPPISAHIPRGRRVWELELQYTKCQGTQNLFLVGPQQSYTLVNQFFEDHRKNSWTTNQHPWKMNSLASLFTRLLVVRNGMSCKQQCNNFLTFITLIKLHFHFSSPPILRFGPMMITLLLLSSICTSKFKLFPIRISIPKINTSILFWWKSDHNGAKKSQEKFLISVQKYVNIVVYRAGPLHLFASKKILYIYLGNVVVSWITVQ